MNKGAAQVSMSRKIGNNGGERWVSGKKERKFDNGGLDKDMMIRLVYAHVDMTFSMIR
jgi:hypothetical protein